MVHLDHLGVVVQGEPESVVLDLDGVRLEGVLTIPSKPRGVVIFAHGSGSPWSSPRNRYVAGTLLPRRHATLLFDSLTAEEAADPSNVFDVALLARRLRAATDRVRSQSWARGLPIGYFAASTVAAAALVAAAQLGPLVQAVVTRGGRPDLAGSWLSRVTAPTLLIVGSADPVVIGLNRRALSRLGGPGRLEIVLEAPPPFDELAAAQEVAALAAGWFVRNAARPSGEFLRQSSASGGRV
jgi:predicted alpha/beta-hydrolase family hydrolase